MPETTTPDRLMFEEKVRRWLSEARGLLDDIEGYLLVEGEPEDLRYALEWIGDEQAQGCEFSVECAMNNLGVAISDRLAVLREHGEDA